MATYYANDEYFYEVSIGGKYALFSDVRIKKTSIPENLCVYEVRHEDENWDNPCQIKRGILVNFYGTLITKEPLLKEDESYLDFNLNEDPSFWTYLDQSPVLGLEKLK